MAGRQDCGHHLGIAAFAAGLAVLPFGLPNEYYLTVLIVAGLATGVYSAGISVWNRTRRRTTAIPADHLEEVCHMCQLSSVRPGSHTLRSHHRRRIR